MAQGVARYFATRDGLPLTLPPEEPVAVRVENTDLNSLRISWRPPLADAAGGDAPTGYRVYTSTNGYAFDDGVPVAGESYDLTDVSLGDVRYVRVTATNAGGESFPSQVVGARVGAARILVVGGFDRIDGALLVDEDLTAYSLDTVERMWLSRINDGSYASRHGAAITAAGRSFDGASNEAIEAGDIDIAMDLSADQVASLKANPDVAVYQGLSDTLVFLKGNQDPEIGGPMADPTVELAVRYALDYEGIRLLAGGQSVTPASMLPVGFLGAYPANSGLQRDVEKAKSLLAEAGYADGLSLELHTPDSGGRPDLAVVLKEQWAPAGIDLDILVEPESVYYGENGWLEVDLGITGWGSRPIPQFYLDVMLECGAVWNESHFCDEEFDSLSLIAGSTLDEAERVQAYYDIQRMLIERGPVIIPYFFAQFAALNDQFTGFELKAFAGRTDFRTVSLSG